MINPALPATMRFPNVRVCQYCDREIHGTPWVSNASGQPAPICSPQCKELYERAVVRQGVLPLRGWDVT